VSPASSSVPSEEPNKVVIRVALGQNKVVDRLSLDVWSLHLCVDSNILGVGTDCCCLMLIIFFCTCVVVYSCVCPGQSPGSRPISAIFPPIFVHFRDPVYPDPAPVPGHSGPAPVSGQKNMATEMGEEFSRPFPSVSTLLVMKIEFMRRRPQGLPAT